MPDMPDLITDRTTADVARVITLTSKLAQGTATAAERAEWLTNLKGAYNASDLNRVGTYVQLLTDKMHEIGLFPDTVGRNNWTESDYNDAAALDYYLVDINKIRTAINAMPSTPPVPDTMQELNYIRANNIEQILLDMNRMTDNLIDGLYYSGEVYAGEVY